jgi:pSer/pThr/pTyr-binding forkhead associated (FHA) protein
MLPVLPDRQVRPGMTVGRDGSMAAATRSEIFISYSHRDVAWLQRLKVHLEPLVQRGVLRVWDDTNIQPGDDWLAALRDAMSRARVAVLLVSPDYLASPFVAREELPPILRAAEDGLRITWVPVRASIVDRTVVGALQALRPPEKPLASLRGPAIDRALAEIARRVCDVYEQPTESVAPTAPWRAGANVVTLERFGPPGHALVVLDEERTRMSIGKGPDNDLVLDGDSAVSKVHALLERVSSAWCISDLGSTNGTYVNGDRVSAKRALADGDEALIGRTRLVVHDESTRGDVTTEPLRAPPPRTAGEQRVLVELCRPFLSELSFPLPPSARAIAKALNMRDSVVKQHLDRLYEAFSIQTEAGESRRVRLANEAIQSAAVTLKDLKGPG